MEAALPDPTRFKGKVAIVTGAADGIGAAAATRFAAEGAKVVLADRNPGVGDRAASIGGVACQMDVTAPDAGEALAQVALAAFGHVDILVNNAGIGGSRRLSESDDALIDAFIDTDLKAVLRITRGVLPHLTRPGGRIINVSSTLGLTGWPGTTAYAVAKAGVAQFTRQLAGEVGPEGILVNAVAPGVTETRMTEGHLRNPYYQRAIVEPTPLRRAGQPEEVAAAILFFASGDASFIAGQVLAVDGGWLAARHPPPDGKGWP